MDRTGKRPTQLHPPPDGRFLIDECLTSELVAVAKAYGHDAAYVPHIGKGGWQDWNLVPFAVDHDYIIVTVNRRDFLKQHAKFDIHLASSFLFRGLGSTRG
ncbi:MAG: DUF5615 family PIN-like protein [Xanthobacteraceae bacterium]|nr:DUF5615 family PIN-like protein [Xanthobacteraceae bacterium]